MTWGEYCAYEQDFINERYSEILKVFNCMKKAYRNIPVEGFWINHTTLAEICYIYANDLKPVRQFHQLQGGCDEKRRASIIARLIAMHRPISIKELTPDDPEPHSEHILRINEEFALHIFYHFLDIPADVITNYPEMVEVDEDLLFVFSHRDPQIETLICVARLLTVLARLQRDAVDPKPSLPPLPPHDH